MADNITKTLEITPELLTQIMDMAHEDERTFSSFMRWLASQEWKRRHPEPQPEPE